MTSKKFYFEEKKRRKRLYCPNCDTELQESDNFCRKCGQENHDHKIPIGHLLLEVVEGVTHFDNKALSTFKSLFTKPGQFTKDFLDSKRNRYVPPIRLFFFVSFIYFSLYAFTYNKQGKKKISKEDTQKAIARAKPYNLLDRFEVRDDDSLRTILPSMSAQDQEKTVLTLYQACLSDTLNTFPKASTTNGRAYLKHLLTKYKMPVPDTILIRAIVSDLKVKITLNGKNRMVIGKGITKALALTYLGYSDAQIDSAYLATEHEPITWYTRLGIKLSLKPTYNSLIAKQKDENYETPLIASATNYTAMLSIPFAALVLWILFRKSRKYYYEHLIAAMVFSSVQFIIQGLPFLLMLVNVAFYSEVKGYFSNFLIGSLSIYGLLSIKRIYEVSWFVATYKSILFLVMYYFAYTMIYTFCFYYLISVYVS